MVTWEGRVGRAAAAGIVMGSGFTGLAGLALASPPAAHADPGIVTTFVGLGSDTMADLSRWVHRRRSLAQRGEH